MVQLEAIRADSSFEILDKVATWTGENKSMPHPQARPNRP